MPVKRGAASKKPTRAPATSDHVRPYVPSLDTLDEITVWLGTFRERLRMAHGLEREELIGMVSELELHHTRRRAELA